MYSNHKIKIKSLEEKVSTSDNYIVYFVLTETHLKSYIFDAEINCENYTIIRSDRPVIDKGGVAIYVHNDITVDKTYQYADKICQAVAVYNSTHNLLIIGIYRPPTADEQSFTNCLKKVQDIINAHERADIQIHGDFNFPFINWSTNHIDSTNRRISEQNSARNLISFMEKNLLVQLVTDTTRNDKNTLDLLLTNNNHAIHSVTTEKTLLSDHDFVHCALLYNFGPSPTKERKIADKSELDKINFNRANWDLIREDLEKIDWNDILTKKGANVEYMFNTFTETITNVCSGRAPQYKDSSDKRNKYIPKARRSLLRTRRHVNYEINKITYLKPDNSDNKLKKLMKKKERLELQLRDCMKKEVEEREISLISKIKTNPRAFYTYAKKNCKTYTSVGPLVDENNKLQNDPATMCNILQKQYQKAFSDPKSGIKKPADNDQTDIPDICDINFTTEDVINAINNIPVYSAPGPDKIPSLLLKECKKQLAPALVIIWRTSLDTGQIPDILKKQSIVPVHKKESKAVPSNYRPISLTSHITKVFGRILRSHMVAHLETNCIIHNSQHGFRPGHSCLTQLLHHIDSIIAILEENHNADVIYLDLSKAFDKVNHDILIHKLKLSGISGKILTWITNFLKNRSQQVIIDGATSSPAEVQSGVPQGTVLGPVLFIVYMNDLHKVIKNSLLKCFADDSKLIKSIQNPDDRVKLIHDLEAVLQWTKHNSMEFNADKFQLLQHGPNDDLKISYDIPGNQILEHSNTVKDLGVHVSEDLKWRSHITTITNNATNFANWILRTIRSREPDVMLTMYKSYVLSRLEYTSPVWSPMLLGDISKIESVQRSFTAKIRGLEDKDYWQRLATLKLYSLQRRRERFMIIHLWKIYKHMAPNDIGFSFHEHIRLGPQCQRIKYPRCSASIQTIRFNSFSCTAPRLFNIIPGYIKKSTKLLTFKLKLDKLLRTLPDCPPTPGYRSSNSNSLLELQRLIHQSSTQLSSYSDDDEAELAGGHSAR